MARKTINRKVLREQVEAAEAAEVAGEDSPKKKKAKKKKKATKRKSRAKAALDTRKRLFWGVFNQSAKRVALYSFDQKAEAEQKALDMNKNGKSPHFVQKVKDEIVEE